MPDLRAARAVATLMVVTALTACEASHCPGLARYDPDRAALDANAAAARGERYLLGVHGFTRHVPGQVDRSLPIRMIEGTSDYSECPGLNERAGEYARRFNAALQGSRR